MKFERSRVDFPLWRKKVDSSLFDHKGTTIPTWACKMWNIQTHFINSTSKKQPESNVTISFEKKEYQGWVTAAKKKRKTPAYRLWFDDDLCIEIKHKFLMSYMRSLEQKLRDSSNDDDIEVQIPFWEFLDIEYDEVERVFKFVGYYYQEPSFPELFKRLIGSPALQRIDDEVEAKGHGRIHKQGWKPREELEFEIGAQNVIYTLIDTERKLLYVGEAQDLVKRLSQNYPSIPKWNYFRYSVLPESMSSSRVALERMAIRDMAQLLNNKRGLDSFEISEYELANEKIDV